EQFPKSEFSELGDFTAIGDRAPGWAGGDTVRVVEYFEIELEDSELVQLTDGRVVWWDDMQKRDRIATGHDGKPVSRKAERRRVYVSKTNGVEWLEEREELPIDEIPIVTIYADELTVDGEKRVRGMVHNLE